MLLIETKRRLLMQSILDNRTYILIHDKILKLGIDLSNLCVKYAGVHHIIRKS